jgi:hypothetical protein
MKMTFARQDAMTSWILDAAASQSVVLDGTSTASWAYDLLVLQISGIGSLLMVWKFVMRADYRVIVNP